MHEIFSIGQVGRRLKVQPHKIAYAITQGRIPEANLMFLNKRCFTEAEILVIAKYFRIDLQEKS